MPKVALLLKPYWLKLILRGKKDWEIRGSNTKKRERIFLASKKMLYGEVTIIQSFRTTKQILRRNFHRHGIRNLSQITYKKIWVWKLQDARKFKKPIKFERKKGQVVWCRI